MISRQWVLLSVGDRGIPRKVVVVFPRIGMTEEPSWGYTGYVSICAAPEYNSLALDGLARIPDQGSHSSMTLSILWQPWRSRAKMQVSSDYCRRLRHMSEEEKTGNQGEGKAELRDQRECWWPHWKYSQTVGLLEILQSPCQKRQWTTRVW